MPGLTDVVEVGDAGHLRDFFLQLEHLAPRARRVGAEQGDIDRLVAERDLDAGDRPTRCGSRFSTSRWLSLRSCGLTSWIERAPSCAGRAGVADGRRDHADLGHLRTTSSTWSSLSLPRSQARPTGSVTFMRM
jgi:hypothetical protein